MAEFISYQEAGVNIDANEAMVEEIYSSVKSTYGPRVMAAKNGFAGLFRLKRRLWCRFICMGIRVIWRKF